MTNLIDLILSLSLSLMLLTLKPENLQPDIKSHHTQKQAQDKFAHKITVYTKHHITSSSNFLYFNWDIFKKIAYETRWHVHLEM